MNSITLKILHNEMIIRYGFLIEIKKLNEFNYNDQIYIFNLLFYIVHLFSLNFEYASVANKLAYNHANT